MEPHEIHSALHKHHEAMGEYHSTKSNKLKFLDETIANEMLGKLIECYKNTGFKPLYDIGKFDPNDEDDIGAYERCMFYYDLRDLFRDAIARNVDYKEFNDLLFQFYDDSFFVRDDYY